MAKVAAAIGEPARARMLCSLLDGRARTSTELAVLGGVSPSTASVHLNRLVAARLLTVLAQGKHRYYRLRGTNVAAALESLSVVAGGSARRFVPNTPVHLRAARTCYDHIAGQLGVVLRSQFEKLGWMEPTSSGRRYELTNKGAAACEALGIDVAAVRAQRRQFAYPCLDWSERQPHIGGALGATLLNAAVKKKWLVLELDSRALRITSRGRREIGSYFGIQQREFDFIAAD